MKQIILFAVFQVLFTCIFGFSYAKVYLKTEGDENDDIIEIYNISGRWIETLLLCLSISALMTHFYVMPLGNGFFLAWLMAALNYILMAAYYRLKLQDISRSQKFTVDNALINPALLTIGVNIYFGSSIYELLDSRLAYYLPLVILVIYFVLQTLISKTEYKKIFYVVYAILFLFLGFLALSSREYSIPDFELPFKNLFLAVMVSLFLSIFECWYCAFRQLKNMSSKKYTKTINMIVTFVPCIVMLLFPFQNFGIIYFITSIIGIEIASYVWYLKILPAIFGENIDSSAKKKVAYSRAILGILTLLFLCLDRYFNRMIPVYFEVETMESVTLLTGIIGVIGGIVGIIKLFIGKKKEEKQDEKKDYFIKRFVICKMFGYPSAIILQLILGILMKVDGRKLSLSWVSFAIFILSDIYCYIRIKKRSIKYISEEEMNEEEDFKSEK